MSKSRFPGKSRFPNVLVWINGAVPAALIVWDAFHHTLGADPVNFALRTTGLLSLIFLVLSLFITPIRQLSGLEIIYPFRRTLGLYAAFYAFAHFGIFFWLDRQRNISSTVHEILTRKYIWFGMLAVLIFIPLALTSTTGMIQRLGPVWWKRLHRLVYLAAIGAAIHYLLVNKIITRQTYAFCGVIAGLLIYRIIASHVLLRRAFNKQKAASAAAPKVALKPKFWKGKLRVVGTFDETPNVRTFRLAPANGATTLPFDYLPGQYLNLALSIDGKPVKRSYTIASSPTRTGYCELTVKREDMGLSSRHLHQTIRVGDVLDVSAPAGKFTFTGKEADSLVLIAGGVGITPLMGKIRYLTDLSWPGEIYLIFSAKTERDIIFRRELELLQQRHANLHVTITLTRETSDAWKGERGRLSPELLTRAVPNLAMRTVHICGPTEMTEPTRQMLLQLGVPESKISTESFTSPSRATSTTPTAPTMPTVSIPSNVTSDVEMSRAVDDGSPAMITFSRSGKMLEVAPEQTILEAAEAAGVDIDFDCRSGICGRCKSKLITGNVTMESEDALTSVDRANNLILACQAHCIGDVEIDA